MSSRMPYIEHPPDKSLGQYSDIMILTLSQETWTLKNAPEINSKQVSKAVLFPFLKSENVWVGYSHVQVHMNS